MTTMTKEKTKEEAVKRIADLLESSKTALNEAWELAAEHDIVYTFETQMQDLYEEITGEYVDWYSSSC